MATEKNWFVAEMNDRKEVRVHPVSCEDEADHLYGLLRNYTTADRREISFGFSKRSLEDTLGAIVERFGGVSGEITKIQKDEASLASEKVES